MNSDGPLLTPDAAGHFMFKANEDARTCQVRPMTKQEMWKRAAQVLLERPFQLTAAQAISRDTARFAGRRR
jgi:hypothetical protein